MQETFGNVTVTYEESEAALEHVRPEDAKVLKLVEAGYDCRHGEESSWPVLYHLSHLRANLVEWLPIGEDQCVLEFGADSGQLTGSLVKKAGQVICLEESISRSRILAKRHAHAKSLQVYAGNPWDALDNLKVSFDWIIAPGILADAGRYFRGEHPGTEAVRTLLTYLKPGGHLVLASDNRFGLKYWAGAAEPHTGRYFDSLEGNGSSCSRRELERILEESGCGEFEFYYPYPERWFPMSIYSDRWLPKTGELNQNLRNFEGERMVLFDEEKVYDQLIADGRFPEFSNTYLVVVGPKDGQMPIYVKYSNDRADQFMIRTDIMETSEGREVRKIPVSEAAKEHVCRMKHWEEVLDAQYEKNGVRANRCEQRDGVACFEYLKGRTWEEKLDELRGKRDYAGLAAELQNYKKLLTDTLEPELTTFKKSRDFVDMFGNPEFAKAYAGAGVNNLDWIFGNLMETDSGIQIIDYEWTFPVQVPVEYLVWRAVSLYLHSREDIQDLGLMDQLGISEEEERIFEEMEHHFQLWLLDGNRTIGSHYLATAGKTIPLEQMLGNAEEYRMKVYVDTGSGFSEAESFWLDMEPDKRGIIHLEIVLPQGTKGVRLDPSEQTCLVKVRRLLGELGGTYPLPYMHNGRELEDQGILYTTQDPQIVVTGLVEGTGRIYAELTLQHIHPDMAYMCMNLLNRVRSAERIYNSAPFRLLKKLKHALRK